MEALAAYRVPVTSLRNGRNVLDFQADWRFFKQFEGSPVEQGKFDITVLFDKYTDHWHLHFNIHGTLDTECDRCLVPISLPVTGAYELYVKFDSGAGQSEDVVNVPKDTTHFDLAQYLYEFIVLSVPVAKTYDCDQEPAPPCDMEMLARISAEEDRPDTESPWEALRGMQAEE